MPLQLERSLIFNTRTQVLVVGPGVRVKGVSQNEIAVAGGNNFGAVGDNPLAGALGKIAGIAALARQTAGVLGGPLAQSSAQTQLESIVSWQGSAKPVFSIQMFFTVLEDDNDNVLKDVTQLLKTVYPTVGRKVGIGKFSTQVFNAPLGYNPSGKGTLDIQIGTWFKVRKAVMKDVNFSFSVQKLKSGRPLFATGNISFEPFRAITFNEMKNYFIL